MENRLLVDPTSFRVKNVQKFLEWVAILGDISVSCLDGSIVVKEQKSTIFTIQMSKKQPWWGHPANSLRFVIRGTTRPEDMVDRPHVGKMIYIQQRVGSQELIPSKQVRVTAQFQRFCGVSDLPRGFLGPLVRMTMDGTVEPFTCWEVSNEKVTLEELGSLQMFELFNGGHTRVKNTLYSARNGVSILVYEGRVHFGDSELFSDSPELSELVCKYYKINPEELLKPKFVTK